ncbi:MAG: autotransporter domain-containing protein [Proteobacteria bacterium]|nr:autotransporter domain-containing protein [Pseudomonadota bacterium]
MLKSKFLSVAMNTTKIFLFFCLVVFFPVSVLCQGTPFYPNDPYFFYNATERPGFPGQWHLVNQGPASISFYSVSNKTTTQMINGGIDAGLRQAWSLGYTGYGVTIGIVDSGVDGSNYDIVPGYRANLSKNFSDNTTVANASQGPQSIKDNHGTSVAGVAAARGGNSIGGTGAAPYAGIAGLRINLENNEEIGGKTVCPAGDPCVSDTNYQDAYYWKSGVNPTTGVIEGTPEIQIKNHSYGNTSTFSDQTDSVTLALKRTAVNGVIHVFAAGNNRDKKAEDANKDADHNNSSVITVAALGSDGKFANYSSYGSSVFVTAPSNRSDYTGFGITTTDRTGEGLGYNRYSPSNTSGDADDLFPDTSYASMFGGTSSAAPLVSGIMALGKEANPEMDVRMAKHALVKTSTVVDPNDASDSSSGGWRTNGAGNKFNPNYGFGNINAGAFVQKVKSVAYITEQTSITKSLTFSTPIPDNDPNGVSKTFSITATEAKQPLEGVEVGLTFTHERIGDLTAKIESPTGMQSRILYSTSHLASGQQDTASVTNGSWTFLTNAFWGENSTGVWTLNLADIVADKTGTWLAYNVTLLMGDMVLLTPGTMTQSTDINAQSLTVANSTTYQIPTGMIFRVRNNVLVDGGTLTVNGQITEAPGYQSTFSLVSGTVGGSGTITASRGFINSGGTVSPGNSIGTLTINGNYTQAASGKLSIEASATGNDRLTINGSANPGGSLEVLWVDGYIPAARSTFTFLTASGGVNGTFAQYNKYYITPTLTFLPKYDIPNQVYLMVERDYTNQTLLPYLTANQRAVGSMLNSVGNTATGDLDTVLTVLDGLPAYGQTASALDQLAPKGSDAQSGMGISSASFQTGNLSERLSDLRHGIRGMSLNGLYFKHGNGKPVMLADINPDLTGMLPSGVDERWGFFVKGNAVYGDQKDTPDATGYNFTSMGVTMGSDYHFSKSFIAGLMLGLNTSRANVDNTGSKVKMDGYTLGAYGTYYKKNFYMDGSISYGFANYDNTRRIVFPGLDRTATASPNGNQLTAYTGTGYDIRKNNWIITPNVSFQYVKLGIDSYTERGAGALSLDVDKQNTESLQGNIGARVSYTWQTDKAVIMPGIRASYGYEFSRDSQNVTSRLAQGSSPFSIQTMSPDRNFLSLGAGITAFTVRDMSVYINYDVQIGENKYVAQSVNAGLRVGF